MSLLASAWAQEQQGLDRKTHAVLQVLARCSNGVECSGALASIVEAAGVDAVEWHVATLVNAGLLLIQGGHIELTLDVEMLRRHLQRNRRQLAPTATTDTPARLPEPPRTKQPPAPPAPSRVFVRQGSPEWDAWMKARPRGAPTSYSPEHKASGWWFPSQWPDGQQHNRRQGRE